MISSLINKSDTFEIVRNKVAQILATETANQQSLATAATLDPTLWAFKVYLERAEPWSEFQNGDSATPIVNVWFDSETAEESRSNVIDRQTCNIRINVDVYALGVAADNPDGGHYAGDQKAAENCHRIVKLVRNILMAATYTYLELRGTVGRRWIDSVTSFQPPQDSTNTSHVVASRLTLSVLANELSPQVQGEALETVVNTITLSPSGEVIVSTVDLT